MSTTIDQRVVEMRFDNKHFEQNVSTTMSTLDKLKQKLNLDSASKGLDQVNNAAKNVNMTGLGSAVEAVSAKFSALQVMGITALANITNSAVNAGKRIVKSLTIEPVTTGFNEYELKMGSIQTIMAGTGESLETVNKYLGELNEYSDKTIYSFKDMTSNIGKFTNAGVKLEDAVLAIKGISNEAAVSGANANEASRAMYNFSQALSAGFVKLIDWKSIENANMATKEFKEQLIQTAVEVGTLKKGADGMYDVVNVVSKANAVSLNSTKNFNDSLGNQWMTTEVLIETLRKYADENTEIGKKAAAAATEVKTFTMLMDTLKESAQSGWAQTWEILVGDFNQAKSVFTKLSDVFGSIIGKTSDIRNKILESALGKGFSSIGKQVNEVIKPATSAVDSITKSLESLEKVTKNVIRGNFGNGKDRIEALTKAGYNYYEVQNNVNKTLGNSFRFTKEQIAAQDKLLGSQKKTTSETEKQSKATSELTDEQKKQLKNLVKLTDAELKAAGYSNDQIKALKELRKQADKLGIPIDEFIDKLDEINGRWLLLNSFKNIGKQLSGVFTALRNAWMDIFPETSIENTANKLFDLISAFHRLTSSINIVDKETGELTEVGEKIRRTFKGVFAAVDLVATILSGPLKFAVKIVSKILKEFGLTALDVTAGIGDMLVKFRDKVDGIIGFVTDVIVKNVTEWIKKFKETEFVKNTVQWFKDASDKISDAVDNVSKKLSEFKAGPFFEKLAEFGKTISDLATRLHNTKLVSGIIDSLVTAFGKVKDFFSNFGLPELSIDNLKTWATDLLKIGEKISASGKGGFLGAISGFGQHLKDNVLSWNWTVFKETALEKFVNFWLKTGDRIKSAFEKGKEVAQAIKRFIFGADEVDLPTILSVAEKFLGIIVLFKTLNLLNGIVEPFDNITDALNNFAASMKWKAISGAFKAMALALGAFTLCIVVISQMPDMKKAWNAVGMLATLMIVMGGVVTAMGLIAAKADSGLDTAGVALSLLALMGAIVLLVYAIKEIDKMELKDPSRTFNILAGVLLAMTIGVAAISKAGGSSFRSVAAILTMMAALKMLLDVIDSYEKYDWVGKRDAIKKVMEMLLGLSLAIRIASGGTKAGASSTGLAFLLLSMIISLKMLVGVIEDFAAMDESDLKKGGAVVAALLGIFTLMAVALNTTNKGGILEKGQKSVNNFAGLAIALMAVVASIWILGKMDVETLKQGGYAVGQILLLFTVMLGTLGKACSGLKMGPIITMLIGFGLLMAEMALIIKFLEDVPWQNSLSSAGVLSAMMLTMATVLRVLTKHNIKANNIVKWIGAMTALTGLVAILAFVLYSIKDMNPVNAIGSAIALSGVLAAMSGALHILSALDMRKLSSNKMQKLAIAFVGLSAILGLLAFVLYSIKDLDPANAIGNAAALSILLGVMSGVLFVISNIKVNAKNVGLAVLGLAALGLVVWELGAILSSINKMNIGNAIPAVMSISALIIVLTVVLAALTGLGAIMAGSGFIVAGGMAIALAGLAALGLVVWELGAILNAMKDYNLGSAMPMVEVLTKFLFTLTIALAALSIIGLLGVPAMSGIVGIAALGLVVWELGAILNAMRDYNLGEAMPMVTTLSALLNVLVDALKVLTVIGIFGVAALVGVNLLGILALELALVMWGLSKIKDVDTARANVETINALLGPLSAMIVMVSMMGPNALLATAAITGMVLLVEGLTIFALAVGALSKIFGDGVEASIEKGLGILKIVAGGLGGIISAFLSSATSDLPTVADNLSKFTEKLNPFVSSVRGIGDDVATGAGNLIKAVLAIIAADVISDLVAGMSSGRFSLATLADELCGFAKGAVPFMDAMRGIDGDAASGVEALCNALSALTSANIKDALVNLLPGDNSLSTFGKSISEFAGCIKDASISLTGITDEDVENIKRSAAAGLALSELTQAIPRTGGLWQKIAGEKDLASWGNKISSFADSLVAYSAKVSGKTIDSEAIKTSAEAATAIADLNSGIPTSGGAWQKFAGEKDIATWGAKISTFADGLISYSNKVTGANLDAGAITKSAEAAAALADVNDALPKTGGGWQDWFGEKSLETFGAGLTTFASGLVSYSNAAAQIDDDDITAIKNTGKAMDEIKLVVEKIPKTGGTADWFGNRDVGSFGSGINALATGIKECITVSSGITEDEVTEIGNLKSAIAEIKEVFTDVPEVNTEYTSAFKTAITHLKSACDYLHTISTAGYDFSGIDNLKTEIKSVAGIFGDFDMNSVFYDWITADNIATEIVSCANALSSITSTTYGGVDTLKAALNSLAEANIDGVIKTFSGKAEAMTAAVNGIISAMSKGLSDGATKVSTAASDITTAAAKAVENKKSSFQTAGEALLSSLVAGIENKLTSSYRAGGNAGSRAADGAKAKSLSMESAGKDLGSGLVTGIDAKQDAVYWAGYRLGQKAVEGEKDGQASNSPSKLTIKAGKWIGEGLVIGMERMGKFVYGAGRSLGQNAVGSISKSISTISDAISTDIDAQPTIRPIMDLSDVRAGTSAIGSMLNMGSTIGVRANIGSISSMMNARSMGATNNDVVSAIDKLRKDLSNVGGTTYNVNGVTYDDGSNVSSAIESLVRYAKIERRV